MRTAPHHVFPIGSSLRGWARAGAALAAGIIALTTPVSGQSVWTGATNTDWSDPGNWTGGAPSGTSTATFPIPTGNSPALGSAAAVGELMFYTGTTAKAFTGSTLTINGVDVSGTLYGIDNRATAANSPSFANPIAVGASQTWRTNNTTNGSLTFTGNIDLGSNTLTLTPTNAVNAITASTGVIGGSGGNLVVAGSGLVTLSGANTYTGTTTVNSGAVLRATTNASALGAGTLTLNGSLGTGASLQLANDTGLNFGRNTTVTGSSSNNVSIVSDRLTTGAGVTHTLGSLTIGAQNVWVSAGSNVTSGTAGLTFSGTTTLSGNATFAPQSGTLVTLDAVTGTNTNLTIYGAGDAVINGVVSTGSGRLVKDGTGTLTLNNSNTHTGVTNVNNGTLMLGTAGGGTNTPLGTTAAGTNVYAAGALDLNGFTLGTAEALSLNGAGFNGGGALINSSGTAASYSGLVTLGKASSIGGSGNITLTNGSGIAGNFLLTKTGAGTLTINNSSGARTGGAQIDAGTLRFGSTTAIGANTQTITLNGGTLDLATNSSVSAYPVVVTGNSTIDSNRSTTGAGITHTLGTLGIGGSTLTINSGANVSSGTAGVTFGATTLTGNATFNVVNGGSSSTLLTLGALNDGGAMRDLTKTGTGTLTLGSAATSLVNGTTVNITGGTLNSNNATALGSLANVTTATGGTLSVGANQTVGALNGSAGSVNLNANTLTVGGTNNLTSAYGGTVSGTGALTKAGTGTFTLSGNNTYSGLTTVSAGTLKLGAAGSGGNGPLGTTAAGTTVSSGGALDLNGFTLANAEALTINGTGVASGGALTNTGAAASYSGVVTLGSAASIGGTGNITLSSGMSGSAALTKVGANTLNLTANNTSLTGSVTVAQGELSLNGANGRLGNISGIAVNTGGTLTLDNTSNNNTDRLAAVGLTANGGTLNFTHATNTGTYSETIGALTLNSGALNLNLSAATGAGSSTFTVSSITRNAGSSAIFTGVGLGASNDNAFVSTAAPTLSANNNILAWAVINDNGTYNLATYNATGTTSVKSVAGTNTAQGSWNNTINARNTGDQALNGNRTVGALILDNGIDINSSNTSNRTITLGSGAILQTGGSSAFNAVNTNGDIILAFGATQGVITTIGNLTLTLGNTTNLMTGSGGIVKAGGGRFTNEGNNNNSGILYINDGTWRAEGLGVTNHGGGTDITANKGILELARSSSGTFTNTDTAVNGDFTFRADRLTSGGGSGITHTMGTVTANRTVNINFDAGANVTGTAIGLTTGAITLNADNVTFTNDSALLNLTTAGISGTNRSFNIDNDGSVTVNGAIATGTGTLTKTGTGTLTFSGSTNTYTGTTFVDQGTLALGASDQFAATAGVSVRGGTFSIGGFSDTLGAVSLYSGSITGTSGILTGASYEAESGSISAILGGTGVALTKVGSGTVTLTSNSTYTGATTISGGTLQIGSGGTTGSLSSSSAIANHGALVFNRSDNVGVSNTISGAGTLTQNGAGNLTLSGTNTNFTGAVAVNSGSLIVANASALGASSTAGTTVANNAALALSGGIAAGNGNLTLTGDFAGAANTGALYQTSGTNTWSGNIALAGNATISAGANNGTTLYLGSAPAIYSRTILGNPNPDAPTPSALIDLGANTLTLTGAAGTTLQVRGHIVGTGGVTINTDGTVKYTGAQNTYTGLTLIEKGTLSVETLINTYPNDLVKPNYFGINGAIQIGDGSGLAETAILQVPAASSGVELLNFKAPIEINSDGLFRAYSTQSIGALTMNGGKIDVGSGTLFLSDTVTVASGSALITGSGGNVGLSIHNASAQADRVFNLTGDLTIDSGVTINTGSITKNGTGTLFLSGDNSSGYSGTTTINNGIVQVSHDSALGQGGTDSSATIVNSGGTVQLAGNVTVASEKLVLNSTGFSGGALNNLSGTNTWGGNISLGSAALVNNASGTLTLSGTMSADPSTTHLLTVNGAASTTTTISGSVNTLGGGITKTGDGTLVLSGNNGYTGASTITDGTVIVQHNRGLGSVSSGVNGTFVSSGAELQLSGAAINIGNEEVSIAGFGHNGVDATTGTGALRSTSGTSTVGGLVTLTDASLITASNGSSLALNGGISGSSSALTIGTTTLNGNISTGAIANGTGSLTKNGSGSLTIAGTTTNVGTVNMNAGTLNFNSTTTNTGTVNMNAGALNFNGTTANTGAIHLLGGQISVGGSTTVNSGAIDSAALTTLAIASGGTVNANYASGSTTFSGAMSGAGTFNAYGAGTLVMDNSFTAAGLTLMLGGTTIGGSDPATYLTLSLTNGVNLQFGTIHITGDTILDFGSSTSTILNSATLIIDEGVKVQVKNWVSLSDIWYATSVFKQGGTNIPAVQDITGVEPQNQVTFDGYSNNDTIWATDQGGQYYDYEIRPTPEPATYGLIFLSGSLALFGLRRYRQRRHA